MLFRDSVRHDFDFKNDVHYHWRANGQALDSIDQPNVAGLRPKDLDKQIRSSICHGRVLSKLLSGGDQHCKLDELLKSVEVAEMLLCGCQRIERSDARGLLTFLNRKNFAQAAGNGELSIYHGQHSAEEKQVSDVRRLHVSAQRCGRRGQRNPKLLKT